MWRRDARSAVKEQMREKGMERKRCVMRQTSREERRRRSAAWGCLSRGSYSRREVSLEWRKD
jgi:hypothetical protein